MRLVLLLVSLVLVGCHKLMPDAPAEDQLLDGPVDGLSTDEQARFLAGDVAFNDEVFTSATGLGPLFVSTSCGSCHAGDGRGHPFTSLTRFGQNDGTGNQFLDQGGPQLQHRALPGFTPEEVPAGTTSTRLLPPPNTGLGFLDAVPDAMILALAGTAQLIRIMRANLLDELRRPYVATARARGLVEWRVIVKYPVRAALNPFASTIGYLLPFVVSGSIVVSLVLSLPTVGPLLLRALVAQDMFLAGTIVLLLGVLTVVGTFISDLVLMWIDPRIRAGIHG